MKRRIFISLCMAVLACATVYAQTAVLVRNNQPVGAYLGVDALKIAVYHAQDSGDQIILSSGTFNWSGETNKAVSIYGQGFEGSNRTIINKKLCFRSNGEGSLDNIHIEGVYFDEWIDLLNDNDHNPINNFTLVNCRTAGLFFYMDSNNTIVRNCVIHGDFRGYNGTYTTTGMLIENCWKDRGVFTYFTDTSSITISNSIFYDFGTSAKATWENSVLANSTLSANSSAENCVLINMKAASATTTNCPTVSSVTEAFENVTTLVYSEGTVPVMKSDYTGIGITAGEYAWNTTPSFPTVNYATTLEKDTDGFYKIGTTADWVEFKRVVENFEPMANAKMTADIDLGDAQAMIGNGHYNNENYRRAYGGIFDGQGHTLTIHFVTADIVQLEFTDRDIPVPSYPGCAPFGYVWGGTIRNLNTAGTITATHEGTAGIAGWTNGVTLIENCHSSVDITYTDGNRGAAGITYNTHSENQLTIRDCIYDGTLTAGSNKTGTSGFVVYRGAGTVNIYNSLLTASYGNGMGSSDCATFVRNQSGIISNSFYQTALGTAQGIQATDNELANGRTAFYLQAGREDLVWGQEIGVDPYPVLTNDESKRVYRSADGYTNDPSEAITDQALVPLTYTRNSNNELTIIGFDQGFTPPADYTLVIPDEIDGAPVVAIANSAFYQKSNFTSLYIGKNVKTIGDEAFRQAKGFTSVTFANDCVVESLGNSAFRGCDALTSFTMPNTVKTIGEMCFQANPQLATVTISNQLTVIAPRAFAQNPLLDNVVIPTSVTTISNNAFYQCTDLTSIDFPANVTKLGGEAFRECSSLAHVTIPVTITSMDANVFWNSGVKTADVYCTVMGQGTFYQCAQLESVNIHEGVTTLGLGAFHGCTKLPTVEIPQTVTTMLENVFQECSSLTTVSFASDIQLNVIPKNAFYKSGLTGITIPTTVTTIGENAFGQCNSLQSVTIPASVTSIGNSAFSSSASLETVTFSDGINITNIPNACFYECRALESISIPASVTSIDDEAFRRCSAMTSVIFPEGTALTTIGNGAFRGCSALPSITIPESVTSIGERGFQASSSLESVTLPNTITVIKNYLFAECSQLNNVVIPNSVSTIESYAFSYCTSLENISLPQGLKTICTYAFQYCSALNNVTLPGTLVTIQDWAFRNCTSMEKLIIEEGITNINRDVFQFSGMKKVVLPSTLEFMGVNAFNECPQLEELDFTKCVNIWELYNMTNIQRTGGSGQWNIFFGIPASTLVKMPPYVNVEPASNVEVATLTFDLQQDNEGYYPINNATDWDKFVVYSRQNPTVNGRLTADLNLTDHKGKLGVGSDESNYITYQGTFDGQGHTLTIEYKTGKDVSGGLFAYVENATIKNLKVEGNITANNRLIGGFVGFVKPSTTLTMQDCESAVHFTVTPTTTNMHIAGFIGQGKTGTVTLTDCLFTGSITGSSSFRYAAAFLGWMESAGRITYNYCLNNGTFTSLDANYAYALGSTQNKGQTTAVACYNNMNSGGLISPENLYIAVSAEQLASGMVTYRLQGGRTEQHWGQLLGRDPYPLLTNEEGTLVYRGQTYTNEYVEYAGLQKDEDDYYLIGGAADWEEFCLVVEDFPKSNARMTADVEVADNSMVGTSSMPYSGIFDGQGHTLSVKYLATADYCAPFRYINGATICNLHTMGTINTAYRVAGGVAADLKGTNTIDQCWSSISITSTYSGDVTNGGIVAYNESGTLDITNCLFDGSMTGSNAYSWGGLVGWRAGTVNMTNCLFIPTSVNVNEYSCATFVRNNATINNSYYSQTINNSIQGTQVTADQLTNGYATYKLQGKQDELVWAQTLGMDEQPMLALFATDGLRVYRTIEGYSNNPEEGVLIQDAEGYYLIGSVDDWKMLAMLVDEGEYEAKARMTADIDLGDDQTMIGSGDNDDNHGVGNVIFQGTFDGQGHTLTIHYNVSQITVAPFRHIQNATIKNLHVAGTITTSNRHAGGIVGACYGEQIHSYITNCISSVNITSNYVNTGDFYGGAFTGGIAARLYYYGQLHITDCIFDGSISGETRGVVWGGFLGLPDGTVTIENSLQIGTFNCSNVISGSNGSGTFSSVFGNGYASRVNVSNNCYYLNQLGNAQGTLANATTLSDGTITTALQAGRTEEVWVQDDSTGQPILALFKKNNGIATGLRVITDDDNDTWFTLEGMKLDTKPKQPGVYIKNGRRIIIK